MKSWPKFITKGLGSFFPFIGEIISIIWAVADIFEIFSHPENLNVWGFLKAGLKLIGGIAGGFGPVGFGISMAMDAIVGAMDANTKATEENTKEEKDKDKKKQQEKAQYISPAGKPPGALKGRRGSIPEKWEAEQGAAAAGPAGGHA